MKDRVKIRGWLRAVGMTLLLMAVLAAPCAVRAKTAEKKLPDLPSSEKMFLEKDQFGEEDLLSYVFPAGTKISGLKSSKAKVVVPKAETLDEQTVVNLTVLKTGSAVVRFTAKCGKEKRNYKISLVFGRYSCPVSSLKIGGLEWSRFFKESSSWSGPLIKSWQKKMFRKSVLISVKAAKGYTLAGIFIEHEDGQQIKISNGGRTGISAGDTILIQMRYKKTGAVSELVLRPQGDS